MTHATTSIPALALPVHQTTFLPIEIGGEDVMYRQWRVQRQMVAVPDGQRRWDQTYLCLLSWAVPGALLPTAAVSGRQQTEVEGASSDLRAGIDAAAGAGADD